MARLNETSHTDALDVWSAPVIQGDSAALHFSKRHSDMKLVEGQGRVFVCVLAAPHIASM